MQSSVVSVHTPKCECFCKVILRLYQKPLTSSLVLGSLRFPNHTSASDRLAKLLVRTWLALSSVVVKRVHSFLIERST